MTTYPHTPGPWRSESGAIVATVDGVDQYIGTAVSRTLYDVDGEDKRGAGAIAPAESDSNRRLMAAAPDLLAHLALLLVLHSNYANGYITRSEYMKAMDDAADFAGQDIERATGVAVAGGR